MSVGTHKRSVELWQLDTRTAGQLGGSTLTSIFNIHDRNGGGGEFEGGMGRGAVFEWQSKIMAITAEYCKLFALATSLSTHTHKAAGKFTTACVQIFPHALCSCCLIIRCV